MARKAVTERVVFRMHPFESAAHTVLAPESRGTVLPPSCRLIALMMMLWGEDWARVGFTPHEIADRTGMTPAQVTKALDQMFNERLVVQGADGYQLTLNDWLRAQTEKRFPKMAHVD